MFMVKNYCANSECSVKSRSRNYILGMMIILLTIVLAITIVTFLAPRSGNIVWADDNSANDASSSAATTDNADNNESANSTEVNTEDNTSESADGKTDTGEANPDSDNADSGEIDTEQTDPEQPDPQQPDPEKPVEPEKPERIVEPGVERIYGNDRIKTSIAVATELKEELGRDTFDSIIVTRSDRWQDALSGSYLASVEEAPILLVNTSNNNEVLNFIKNNLSSTGTIYILGGSLAVSDDVEFQLDSIGNVVRLAGHTSYDTNLEILNRADLVAQAAATAKREEATDENLESSPDTSITEKLWDTDLLVTTGKNFPDAITISALGKPIMLIYETLSNAQKLFVTKHTDESSNIYIIGGTYAVSEAAETQIKDTADYANVTRIAGSNRYTTSTAVADAFFKDAEEVVLARGDIFPDAMVGGTLAKARGIPLLLTENNSGFESAYKYIYKNDRIKAVTILGGSKALSDDVAAMTKEGNRKNGFLNIGSKLFYAQASGDIYKNQFFEAAGASYGATASGAIAKNGWAKVGNLTYYFKNYLIHDISKKAIAVLDKVGYTLRAAYNWSAAMPYYGFDSNPNWGSIWFADYGFTKLRGNCYVMASTFYIMAKTMGYDITQVAGYVNTTIHRAAHSWTLIKQDGDTWIYDPEFYNEHKQLAFKIKNGDTRWYYNSDYKAMPM